MWSYPFSTKSPITSFLIKYEKSIGKRTMIRKKIHHIILFLNMSKCYNKLSK